MDALFASSELEIFFQPGSSNYLLITFAPLDFTSSIDVFWGRYFAERAGISAIGIVPRRNSWYPECDMLQSIPAISSILCRFQDRITYGSSMGAYGAIKYGNLLGAKACAAFGPQVSINPTDGVTSQAYTRYFQPELHSKMIIGEGDVCPNTFIFFDPKEGFDRVNAEHVSAVAPKSTLITLPHVGHECIKVVAGVKNATRVLEACLAGDKQSVVRLCKSLRSTSPARYAGLASELVSKKPKLASLIIERHGSAFDPKQTALFYEKAAIAHMNKRDFFAAEAAAHAALLLYPNRTSFIRTLGIIYERQEKFSVAAECYEKYLGLNPIDLAVHNALVRVYTRLGDFSKAESSIKAALEVSQTHLGILRQYSFICASQGRLREAISWLDHAVRLKPDEEQTYLELADLLTAADRSDEAEIALERAIFLRPGNQKTKSLLSKMRSRVN